MAFLRVGFAVGGLLAISWLLRNTKGDKKKDRIGGENVWLK